VVTFTRRHYVLIGEMLRENSFDRVEKKKWFDVWDSTFRKDNPRYQHDKFFEFVYPNPDDYTFSHSELSRMTAGETLR